MEHGEKTSPALALEDAKRDLKTRLARTVGDFERGGEGAPLEIRVVIGGEAAVEAPATKELADDLRAHVEAFHQSAAAQKTGVRVQQLTAIDSDADGEVAVNVEYEYPGR